MYIYKKVSWNPTHTILRSLVEYTTCAVTEITHESNELAAPKPYGILSACSEHSIKAQKKIVEGGNECYLRINNSRVYYHRYGIHGGFLRRSNTPERSLRLRFSISRRFLWLSNLACAYCTVTVRRERNTRAEPRRRTEKTKPLGISRRLLRRSRTFCATANGNNTARAPENPANGTLYYYKDNAPLPFLSRYPYRSCRRKPVAVDECAGRGGGVGGSRR